MSVFKWTILSFLFVIFSPACSKQTEKEEIKNKESLLMASLEGFAAKGDTIHYFEKRKEIQNCIDKDNNKKLALYLETHDALKVGNEGNLDSALTMLNVIYSKAEAQKEYYTMFTSLSNAGNIIYFKGNILTALEYWKKAAEIAEKNDLKDYVASTYANIAVGYLNLGYYNNASTYFLKAKNYLDKKGVKDENYWVNYINIANTKLAMNQAENALDYLKKTDISKSYKVRYLYYSNMSATYRKLGNQELALSYLDSTRKFLTYNKEYSQNCIEQELETYLKYKLKSNLQESIDLYLKDTTQKSVSLQCVFNDAYYFKNKVYYDVLSEMLKWESKLDSKDFASNEAYYAFMANVYRNLGDHKKETHYLRQQRMFQNRMIDQKLKNQFEDYLLSQKNEKIQNENSVLALKNKTNSLQLKKQRLIFVLLGSLFVLVLGVVILLYRNLQKTKKLKEQELQLAHTRILETNQKTEDLLEKMTLQQEKLESTIQIVNKISILKKQLDDFFEEVDQFDLSDDLKNKVKGAKLDFKSFFSVYSDLAVQASSLDEFMERIKRIPAIAVELNKKEIQVAQLIINKYTTKEIALLLSRSVKNIEFTRSELRKKLNIPNDVGLNDFLQNI